MAKRFRLAPHEMKDLAPGRGGCIASDMIPVGGEPVRFMYREEPDSETDSGWRFLAGVESQNYVDDRDHFEVYNVNTIADYDAAILPLLDAPAGSAFEKTDNSAFVAVPFPRDPDDN